MPRYDQVERRAQIRLQIRLLIAISLLLASFGLLVLGLRPEFDFKVAALFLTSDGAFVGTTPMARVLRLFAALLPFIVYFGASMLYFGGLTKGWPRRLSLGHRAMVFLTLSLALGPGLLVNGVFKAHFHRPRPVHVQSLGGTASFQPFYRLEGDCAKNCAFPSGETAAAFWTMAPAALTPLPVRALALACATLFGITTGLLRMATGAHFLSDVLFSGCLIGWLTLGLWFLIRPPSAPHSAQTNSSLRDDLATL